LSSSFEDCVAEKNTKKRVGKKKREEITGANCLDLAIRRPRLEQRREAETSAEAKKRDKILKLEVSSSGKYRGEGERLDKGRRTPCHWKLEVTGKQKASQGKNKGSPVTKYGRGGLCPEEKEEKKKGGGAPCARQKN